MQLETQIFRDLAKKHNLHASQVRQMCTHPFIFAKQVISSEDDHKDIRFAYLGTIKLKGLFKQDKTKPYAKTKKEHGEQVKRKNEAAKPSDISSKDSCNI